MITYTILNLKLINYINVDSDSADVYQAGNFPIYCDLRALYRPLHSENSSLGLENVTASNRRACVPTVLHRIILKMHFLCRARTANTV